MERSLLRNRDFLLVSGSVGLSALGDWVAMVALGLHVKEVSDIGLRGRGALDLPVRAVGADRRPRRPAGRPDRGDPAAGARLGGRRRRSPLALSFVSGLAPVLVLTTLLGVVFAISQPAEFALVPPLAGEDRIQEANGHMETIRYIGFGLGPVLGGLLFAVGGLQLAMIVDALTFAARRRRGAVAAGPARARRRWRRASARRGPATASPTSSPTAPWRW